MEGTKKQEEILEFTKKKSQLNSAKKLKTLNTIKDVGWNKKEKNQIQEKCFEKGF